MNLFRYLTILGMACLFTLLTGCSDKIPDGKPPKARAAQLVEAVPVIQESLAPSSHLTGTLQAYSTVRIFNQEEGAITTIPVHEGAPVNSGDLILRMDDKLLQADLNKAVATRKQAEQDLNRLTKLRKRKLVAEEELVRATTALEVAQAEESSLATRLGYTRIQAPISGLVSQRLVEPGDVVPKYTHLLTIIDTSKLLTEVAVSELLMPGLNIDDGVEIRIDALGEQTFKGRILRIHPALDAATRRGKIEVILDAPPADARPGQLCRVTLHGKIKQRNTIPYNALRRDNEGDFVYIIDTDDKAQRRSVQTGLRFADRVEILHGLEVNERVIVRGFLSLKSGKKVRTADQAVDKKP